MKNYDETISTVFDRIGQYHEHQKRKKEIIVRTVTPLCCLCIIAAIGFAVWGQGKTPNSPQFTMEQPLSTTTPTVTTPSVTEPTQPISSNKIVINPMEDALPNTMGIARHGKDFIPMNKEEMVAYYGCNVFPDVPDDISLKGQHWGIYRRNQGTGEIYWRRPHTPSRPVLSSMSSADIPPSFTPPVYVYQIAPKANPADVF